MERNTKLFREPDDARKDMPAQEEEQKDVWDGIRGPFCNFCEDVSAEFSGLPQFVQHAAALSDRRTTQSGSEKPHQRRVECGVKPTCQGFIPSKEEQRSFSNESHPHHDGEGDHGHGQHVCGCEGEMRFIGASLCVWRTVFSGCDFHFAFVNAGQVSCALRFRDFLSSRICCLLP